VVTQEITIATEPSQRTWEALVAPGIVTLILWQEAWCGMGGVL
jgi:hypothetical protein